MEHRYGERLHPKEAKYAVDATKQVEMIHTLLDATANYGNTTDILTLPNDTGQICLSPLNTFHIQTATAKTRIYTTDLLNQELLALTARIVGFVPAYGVADVNRDASGAYFERLEKKLNLPPTHGMEYLATFEYLFSEKGDRMATIFGLFFHSNPRKGTFLNNFIAHLLESPTPRSKILAPTPEDLSEVTRILTNAHDLAGTLPGFFPSQNQV
jgi:hypothetical protein